MKKTIQLTCVVTIVAALGVGTVSADVGYLDDSNIVAWGLDDYGQVGDTPAGTDFVAVTACGGQREHRGNSQSRQTRRRTGQADARILR